MMTRAVAGAALVPTSSFGRSCVVGSRFELVVPEQAFQRVDMGTSVVMIDQRYGHLARDSEERLRAQLEAGAARAGDELATREE
jgi:hypothetical protein